MIRRRAGLRPTLSAYRNPLTASSIQSQQRDKTPPMNRLSTARGSTSTIPSVPPPAIKIDKDIIKHATRIRRMSPSKDQLNRSTGVDTIPSLTSPRSNASNKQQSTKKPSKSMSLVSFFFECTRDMYLSSIIFVEYQWRESSN